MSRKLLFLSGEICLPGDVGRYGLSRSRPTRVTNGLAYSDAIRRIGVLRKAGDTKQDSQPYPPDIVSRMATYERSRQK